MRLVIVVETEPTSDGGPDPTLIDPHDIADALIHEWNDGDQGAIGDRLSFVSAVWDTQERAQRLAHANVSHIAVADDDVAFEEPVSFLIGDGQ